MEPALKRAPRLWGEILAHISAVLSLEASPKRLKNIIKSLGEGRITLFHSTWKGKKKAAWNLFGG